MRIIFMSPYIYDAKHPEFSKNQTGFGYMVKDILEEMSNRHIVTLITHVLTEGYSEKFVVPHHTMKDIIKSLRPLDVLQGIYYAVRFKQKIGLRYLYYFIDKGFARQQLRKIAPDIVHIHGGTYQTKPYIDLCNEMNIPYIITLHGLNGASRDNLATEQERKYEVKLLKTSIDKHIKVTVVSSGCKEKIKYLYGLDTKSITVVLNGTSVNIHTISYQEKKQSGGKKTYNILVIGNICHRKNQLEIIRAINHLPVERGKNIQFYFCGNNTESLPIDKMILESCYKDNIHYLGFVERDEMNDLWKKADLNIVASVEEGFGLSMIEGFSYGVPTLTFSDLEAIGDLYHEKVMVLMDHRNDMTYFSQKILEALTTEWDHDFIKKYAQKFAIEKIADDYEAVYKDVIKEKKNEFQN